MNCQSISSSLYVEVYDSKTPPNSPRTPKETHPRNGICSNRRKVRHEQELKQIRELWLRLRAEKNAQGMGEK